MDNSLNRKRNYSLDVARIIAMLAVVMIHSSSKFVSGYKPGAVEFAIGNLFDGASTIGVPLFLMISGALFLNEKRKVTIKGIIRKNIAPLVFITLVWSALYAVAVPLIQGQEFNVQKILKTIPYGHYHMWYLYMIIGVYAASPVLKKFVNKENSGMVLFFIATSLLVKFSVPVINMICKLGWDIKIAADVINKLSANFFDGYIAYFLIGWYISNIGIKQKRIRIIMYIMGAISYILMIGYTQLTGDYKNSYANIGLLLFVYSVSIFVLINNIRLNPGDKASAILIFLSKLSFGVYLIHVLIVELFRKCFPYNGHPIVYLFITFFTVTAISLLISYVISKTPVLKKLIKA